MSYNITVTWTRPSVDIPWFDFAAYPDGVAVTQAAKDAGKLTVTRTPSEDGLTLTSELSYDMEDTFSEIKLNPKVREMWAARDAYNREHGITQTIAIAE